MNKFMSDTGRLATAETQDPRSRHGIGLRLDVGRILYQYIFLVVVVFSVVGFVLRLGLEGHV